MKTQPQISFENIEVAFNSKSDTDLRKMYVIFATLNSNTAVKLGIKMTNLAFKYRFPVKGLLKKTMFGHFCGGESIKDSQRTIDGLAAYRIGSILDYSVEGEGDEASFDHTKNEILKTIAKAATSDFMPFSVFKVSGLGDYKILIKVQEGKALTKEETISFEKLEERFDELCKAAYDAKVRILVDAEESWFQQVIDTMAYKAMEKYNKETAIVFNTYQMYRHDMLKNLKDAHHEAVAKQYFLGAKLVRGAYMEKERERAKEKGYPSPIQTSKQASDDDYNAALQFCVNNKQRVFLVSGSHNELSNTILTELMSLHGMKPDDERIYFAQLFGMSDNISFNLSNAGYNVAKYVPYGPVKAVIPYLARRAEENTSIAGQSSREFDLIRKEIARRKAFRNK
ncbi:proline dehydrogenase family protein [Anditalea andensis]|uniref:Proline dehydrogenase n=1 Tax=Anditalea andensis TaxID=1048983 RepID=A0A074LLT7_9BACT|nr:proline dehydrogenase family protein [Anditalea andensis]KEO74837.1 proline dehydrogenase [Anditalea andensis]